MEVHISSPPWLHPTELRFVHHTSHLDPQSNKVLIMQSSIAVNTSVAIAFQILYFNKNDTVTSIQSIPQCWGSEVIIPQCWGEMPLISSSIPGFPAVEVRAQGTMISKGLSAQTCSMAPWFIDRREFITK